MEIEIHNKACFMSHLGEWMIKEYEFQSMSSLIISGKFNIPENQQLGNQRLENPTDKAELHGRSTGEERTVLLPSGILIVPISGPTMPKPSKYGGTSTIQLRDIMSRAMVDPAVKAVMLKINSPGGHVEGNFVTAQAFAKFRQVKPLFSHTEEMMASAAVWLGFQGTRISASPMATVGSFGTVSVVYDFSKKFEAEGVEAISFNTGKLKGMGTPGTKITEEQRAFLQNRVNELNAFFKDAVMEARGFSQEKVDELFDGSFGLAQEAKEKGLIDEIETFDEAIASLEAHINKEPSGQIGAENKITIDATKASSATMETQIKQNSEKGNEDMSEEIKSVSELKTKHSVLCLEMEEAAVSSALETERERVNAWASYSDVDPKAVQDGIESKKCITIPQATALEAKRTDSAFTTAMGNENPPAVNTPPEGADAPTDDEKEVASIVANAEKYN